MQPVLDERHEYPALRAQGSITTSVSARRRELCFRPQQAGTARDAYSAALRSLRAELGPGSLSLPSPLSFLAQAGARPLGWPERAESLLRTESPLCDDLFSATTGPSHPEAYVRLRAGTDRPKAAYKRESRGADGNYMPLDLLSDSIGYRPPERALVLDVDVDRTCTDARALAVHSKELLSLVEMLCGTRPERLLTASSASRGLHFFVALPKGHSLRAFAPAPNLLRSHYGLVLALCEHQGLRPAQGKGLPSRTAALDVIGCDAHSYVVAPGSYAEDKSGHRAYSFPLAQVGEDGRALDVTKRHWTALDSRAWWAMETAAMFLGRLRHDLNGQRVQPSGEDMAEYRARWDEVGRALSSRFPELVSPEEFGRRNRQALEAEAEQKARHSKQGRKKKTRKYHPRVHGGPVTGGASFGRGARFKVSHKARKSVAGIAAKYEPGVYGYHSCRYEVVGALGCCASREELADVIREADLDRDTYRGRTISERDLLRDIDNAQTKTDATRRTEHGYLCPKRLAELKSAQSDTTPTGEYRNKHKRPFQNYRVIDWDKVQARLREQTRSRRRVHNAMLMLRVFAASYLCGNAYAVLGHEHSKQFLRLTDSQLVEARRILRETAIAFLFRDACPGRAATYVINERYFSKPKTSVLQVLRYNLRPQGPDQLSVDFATLPHLVPTPDNGYMAAFDTDNRFAFTGQYAHLTKDAGFANYTWEDAYAIASLVRTIAVAERKERERTDLPAVMQWVYSRPLEESYLTYLGIRDKEMEGHSYTETRTLYPMLCKEESARTRARMERTMPTPTRPEPVRNELEYRRTLDALYGEGALPALPDGLLTPRHLVERSVLDRRDKFGLEDEDFYRKAAGLPSLEAIAAVHPLLTYGPHSAQWEANEAAQPLAETLRGDFEGDDWRLSLYRSYLNPVQDVMNYLRFVRAHDDLSVIAGDALFDLRQFVEKNINRFYAPAFRNKEMQETVRENALAYGEFFIVRGLSGKPLREAVSLCLSSEFHLGRRKGAKPLPECKVPDFHLTESSPKEQRTNVLIWVSVANRVSAHLAYADYSGAGMGRAKPARPVPAVEPRTKASTTVSADAADFVRRWERSVNPMTRYATFSIFLSASLSTNPFTMCNLVQRAYEYYRTEHMSAYPIEEFERIFSAVVHRWLLYGRKKEEMLDEKQGYRETFTLYYQEARGEYIGAYPKGALTSEGMVFTELVPTGEDVPSVLAEMLTDENLYLRRESQLAQKKAAQKEDTPAQRPEQKPADEKPAAQPASTSVEGRDDALLGGDGAEMSEREKLAETMMGYVSRHRSRYCEQVGMSKEEVADAFAEAYDTLVDAGLLERYLLIQLLRGLIQEAERPTASAIERRYVQLLREDNPNPKGPDDDGPDLSPFDG